MGWAHLIGATPLEEVHHEMRATVQTAAIDATTLATWVWRLRLSCKGRAPIAFQMSCVLPARQGVTIAALRYSIQHNYALRCTVAYRDFHETRLILTRVFGVIARGLMPRTILLILADAAQAKMVRRSVVNSRVGCLSVPRVAPHPDPGPGPESLWRRAHCAERATSHRAARFKCHDEHRHQRVPP